MAYQYSIAGLATMEKPPSARQGARYDYIGDHIALALAERIEALVAEMAKMNGYLVILTQINPKLDALVEATKGKTAL